MVSRRSFLTVAPLGAAAWAYAAESVRISSTAYKPADYPIQAKRHSEVTLKDAFWKPKVALNADVTIPFEFQKLSERGYDRGLSGGVLEGAILSLQAHPDPKLQALVDAQIQKLTSNPRRGNSGFEVAAVWYNATGKRDLLDHSIQAAATLYDDFRLKNPPFSGGERDAVNCIQLYRVTHDKKHLDLAKHYLDIRGLENSVNRSRHNQSYKPVLEQSEAVGHAVNCVTLMVSLVDVGILTGLREYFDAGQRMWQDAAYRKMYITGGVGTTGNEGFGEAYSLPNISAYAETCAVLMFITLNHRLFLATGDSKYIDVMERGMYNNAVDGVSSSGNRFFYVNRLASAGDGRDERWERASLECCPPNLVRFLAGMPGYIYAQDKKDAVYINLYVSSAATFKVGGRDLTLAVDGEMPWGGKSKVTVSSPEEIRGAIKLRIPGWARNQVAPGDLYSYTGKMERQIAISVNGKRETAAFDRLGYVTIDRIWKSGDAIEVEFPMEPRKVVASPKVKEDRRRIAIERGPIVYCAEWPDVSGGRALELLVRPDAALKTAAQDGVTVIETAAASVANPAQSAAPMKLIPYYLWANRGPGEMTVWLSAAGYEIGDTGPAGGLIFYENSNYASDGWRYLEAAPFDQSAGAKWGCFRNAISGARGTAVGTGKKNTEEMLGACTEPGSAAYLCAKLSLNGVRGWFLPSRDELALMYKNLHAKGRGNFQDAGIADNFTYWASSQDTADMAAHIDFADLGRQHGDDKDFPRRVRAIRAF